jgi:SAM-dependent methyltransferase
MPEYDIVFDNYFDIIDLAALKGKRICDLGCGTGRWAKLLSQKTQLKEIICSDFSEAIFVARRNLRDIPNALFFMADLQRLPFREDFCDFLYCLGVLLTLPTDQLDQVRRLRKFAPEMLFYTYYSLDNRPFWWRGVFFLVDLLRRLVYRVRNPVFRDGFTWSIAAFVYIPLMVIGHILRPFGLARYVPLFEDHHHLNFRWWRLLAYDRFFCGIEKRVSREEILTLGDTFSEVMVSPNSGYWHFLCRR